MNLNSRTALDPRWTTHHTQVVVSFMLAEIRVIRKNPEVELTYNQETGTYAGDFDVVYEGMARVQPYGIIGDMIVGQDPTGRRLMRVQIEELESGINVDDMIEIITSDESPELTLFTLEVRGTLPSSNAWVTDLVCEANTKHA